MGLMGIAIGLLVAAAAGFNLGGFLIASVVSGVMAVVIADALLEHFGRHKRRTGRRREPRIRRTERPADFRLRLSSFKNYVISGSGVSEDGFRSSMPFWASANPISPTPAKSSGYIRAILLRIRAILRS
jgi:hypothetical protein